MLPHHHEEQRKGLFCLLLPLAKTHVHTHINIITHTLQVLPQNLGFAIVDEADSILIDESRNPMIISQPRGGAAGLVIAVDAVRRE